MKKKFLSGLLAATVLLLCGCQQADIKTVQLMEATASVPVYTEPAPTIPPDGNPEDVTCKGSYTAADAGSDSIATAGDLQLTNAQLQGWYWSAVAQYREGFAAEHPDYDLPLDVQGCQIDDSVANWQQYFLRQALNNWHAAAALTQQADGTPLETEEAYSPNLTTHANCMTGMPVTKLLYGYDKTYQTNSMHQAFLDGVPELLERLAGEHGYADAAAMAKEAFGSTAEDLAEFVRQYNYAYMYQTFLNYELTFTEQEIQDWYLQNRDIYDQVGQENTCVDIRQIFVKYEGDWEACEKEANRLLRYWQNKTKETEATFGELAYRNSQDTGSAANGGKYTNLSQGQLPDALDAWCFDPARKSGDTAVLRSEQGFHVVYFSAGKPLRQIRAEKDLVSHTHAEQIRSAKEAFPMDVNYGATCLAEAEGLVSYDDLLYPDIAHERYPEVPLYLQQDYPKTWFGNYKISSNGCGITTFAMLTTYLSDEEWTPPEMCDLYGIYSHDTGTDGMLFINEPAKYGYYFKERVYEHRDAKKALEDGYIVISVQRKGYWTRAAHYLLFEKILEDDMVQVRDSNIANYARIKAHIEDKHTWYNCIENASGYWVFENKVSTMAACARCGDPSALEQQLLNTDYLCHKCEKALQRRNDWLRG